MRQHTDEEMGGASTYDRDFFDSISAGSLRSGRVVAPMVLELVGPVASVVDVGCGTGAWLRVFSESGIKDFLGIDGDYVRRDQLEIPSERFRAMDLTQKISLERQFDLVLCLEVAEHLPPSNSDELVGSLTRLGETILFSAAVPYQGGREHINEQWPEYWAEKFRSRGFTALDPFRARLWNEEQVEPWFAQNLVLYVANHRVTTEPRFADELARTGGTLLSLVHPRLYIPKARSAARLAQLTDSRLGRLAKRMLGRSR
jgi:SAM-dependent methyltransferase